jgi:phage tail sheath gpL-like
MAGTINFPTINASIFPATPSLTQSHKLLVIGLAGTGSYTSGIPIADAPNDDVLRNAVGVGSPMAKALEVINKFNPNGELTVIPLAEAGGGTASTGSIVISGSVVSAGDVKFLIGGSEDVFTVPVVLGDTPTTVATKLRALINAKATCLVGASGSAGTVTLTAKQKGTHGNDFTILVYPKPLNVTGLAFALTAFSGGATNPTFPSLDSTVGDVRYDSVVVLSSDPTIIAQYNTEMESRFNAPKRVLDGLVIACKPAIQGDFDSLTTSLKTSKSLGYMVVKTVNTATHKGLASKRYAFEDACIFGAYRQLRYTNGSFLTPYVQNSGLRDTVGGVHQSTKPYTNTILAGWELPEIGTEFSGAEIELAKGKGLFVIGTHRSGQYLTFSETVTPYRLNSQGVEDDSFKYIETVDTITHARQYTVDYLTSNYSQSALATNTNASGFAIATQKSITSDMLVVFNTLSNTNYILLDSGEQVQFVQNLVVLVNKRTGTVSIQLVFPVISQLRTINVNITLSF